MAGEAAALLLAAAHATERVSGEESNQPQRKADRRKNQSIPKLPNSVVTVNMQCVKADFEQRNKGATKEVLQMKWIYRRRNELNYFMKPCYYSFCD